MYHKQSVLHKKILNKCIVFREMCLSLIIELRNVKIFLRVHLKQKFELPESRENLCAPSFPSLDEEKNHSYSHIET